MNELLTLTDSVVNVATRKNSNAHSMNKFATTKEFCGIQPAPWADKPCKEIK